MIECPRCESTYFQEVEFRQYRVHASAVPGGGYQPDTAVCRARICLCGHVTPVALPMALQKHQGVAADSFAASCQAAEKYRRSLDPNPILNDLARDFVTWSQFEALQQRLESLQNILQQTGDKQAQT